MNKVVAIHQPNFFPWLGFFHKIESCDIFVILDNVQFPRTSRGAWTNRVKFLSNKKGKWFTVPIDREYDGVRNINEVSMKNHLWKEDFKNMLFSNYKKAPYFDDYIDFILELNSYDDLSLSRFNSKVIIKLCDFLNINTDKLVFASDLDTKLKSTELLIEIVKRVDGNVYLSGNGASGYQEDKKFDEAGILLKFQEFKHPTYEQYDYFIEGLSIIDALFFVGKEKVIEMIKG